MEKWMELYASLMFVIVTGLLSLGAFAAAIITVITEPGYYKLCAFVLLIMGFFALATFFMWLCALIEDIENIRRN